METCETEHDVSVELESPFIEIAEGEREPSEEIDCERERRKVVKISLFIQMELCKETLEEYINKREFPLSEEELSKSFDMARQLIEGIRVVHLEHKIIHRDLSLRNIFIGRDEKVKIGDFGLATKCHSLVPLLSSPLVGRPTAALPDHEPESFSLEEGPLESSESELTHGLGTKTFAAPEQMSSVPYDQKADVFSLGLILLALFHPTKTLSERYEVLKNCREGQLPEQLMADHPSIGKLIRQMTSKDQELRPTIGEIINMNVFAEAQKASYDWAKLDINERMCSVKLETAERFKERYIKIIGDTLLLYKKVNEKAKLCYSLNESLITAYKKDSRQIKVIDPSSSHDLYEELERSSSCSKIVIEHPQLETLEVLI